MDPEDGAALPAPVVSVVVPAGEADDLLVAQLRALLAQDVDVPFEIVVSLNIPDPTALAEASRRIAAVGDDRIRVVDSSAVRSASHARNVGARAARASLLAFCDADDVVRPGWLRALVDALAEHDVVGGRLVEFADRGDLPKWRPPATPDGLPTFVGVPYLVSANMAITREAFDGVDGFDESLTRCEDVAISWQLIERGHAPAFVADAIVDYRVRGSIRTMLRQHYLYGIGMSEVLLRIGRPGDQAGSGAALLRPNNQPGGLRSPVGLLRKGAIGAGRVVGMLKERRR
jgi:cellulose synthase/poly-beta-1,6-N-acetylglucosamine synthase-like glycosyltransferase